MQFSLTILGSNAAVPGNGRWTSAQVLQVRNRLYLIDCGEGTQWRLSAFGIQRRERIEQIFISHLHGDHIYGLPGVLTSFSLNQRTSPLTIYAPAGLQEMLEAIFKYSYTYFSYPINYVTIPTDESVQIFEDSCVKVTTIPLDHRIPTTGFLFEEKERPANIRPSKIKEYNIPFSEIKGIKLGNNFTTEEGKTILNSELTTPPPPPRKFAYCSDTAYSEEIIPQIKGVDLLYHETTFIEKQKESAKKYGHSTAKEAASIAKKAEVKRLICGHYSSRYQDVTPILEEALTIFKNTELGLEGKIFEVKRVNGKE